MPTARNTVMSQRLPFVSVLLPVFNEAESIGSVLTDLLNQDYAGEMEVVVADGDSTDGTAEVLARWAEDSSLVVISNPHRRQGPGLNKAALEAEGDVLIRADGHSSYAADYVSASVEALREDGGAVGGRMNPVGSTPVERAVAAAMNSPLTMGPARFHHAVSREEVDTVYLGAFSRRDFEDVGGFRSFPSGSSEDADFYYRWRASGRHVFVDPRIVTHYTPRGSWLSLWRQYWRYGQGKGEMWWANGRLPSWRPLAPLGLVVGLLAGGSLGVFAGTWWPLGGLAASWTALLLSVGMRSPASIWLTAAAALIMHLAYGLGMVGGVLTGWFSTRSL